MAIWQRCNGRLVREVPKLSFVCITPRFIIIKSLTCHQFVFFN